MHSIINRTSSTYTLETEDAVYDLVALRLNCFLSKYICRCFSDRRSSLAFYLEQ